MPEITDESRYVARSARRDDLFDILRRTLGLEGKDVVSISVASYPGGGAIASIGIALAPDAAADVGEAIESSRPGPGPVPPEDHAVDEARSSGMA